MRGSNRFLLTCWLIGAFAAQSPGQATKDAPAKPPKVVLIGDSIRLGYAPGVTQRLARRAQVVSPSDNGGDSKNVLEHLDEWVIREQPDLVHLNCGLHDLKQAKADGTHQVEVDAYRDNLKKIVGRIQKETHAAVVFANTTPIVDERHAKRGADFDRREADVARYNDAAQSVMRELGVPVDDLHWVIERAGRESQLGVDGTHYTPAGYNLLADAVADCLDRQITIVSYRPLPLHASGPQAGEAYRKAQAERDAQVDKAYRDLHVPALRIPASETDWKGQRPAVLKAVQESLGDLPPRPSPKGAKIISRELRPGFTVEKIVIPDEAARGFVTALVLVPDNKAAKSPAILWLHSSTPDKTQILIPNTNGGAESLGEAFVKAGYVVLAPDAYWHGDRVGTGPSGPAETSRAEEDSLFKFNSWMGRTLWGMFVRDDQIALDYLCSRPEVDTSRIGATGMSMGSTRSWWLAAVDDRIAAVAAVACFTRYQNLIAHGELRQHGVYYFVDGLLKHFDTEGVLALISPRALLVLTGDLDAGSPADGVRDLEREVGRVYQALDSSDRFRNVLYTNVGHSYTPEMRAEVLDWFGRWLKH